MQETNKSTLGAAATLRAPSMPPFSDATPRSVADIDSAEALEQVRAWKKAQKAAGKSKQE